MSLEVDGAAVMTAIAKAPAAFGLTAAQLNALALTLVTGRLKDKAVKIEQLRSMWQQLGADDCRLALDQCASKEIAAIVKRVDAKNPDLKGSDEAWQRSRIVALIEGAEPAQAPARVRRPAAAAKGGSKTGAVMGSKALAKRNTDALIPPHLGEGRTPTARGGAKRGTKSSA